MRVDPRLPPTQGPTQRAAPASLLRRHRLRAATLAAATLLVSVLWITGGLQPVAAGAPQVEPGAAIDQERFTVRVADARVERRSDPFDDDKPPQTVLLVRMRVTNHGKETASLGGGTGFGKGVVARAGGERLPDPEDVEGTVSGGEVGAVQPGMTTEADVVWVVPEVPREVTVGFHQWSYGAGFVDTDFKWTVDEDRTPVAEVRLGVRRR